MKIKHVFILSMINIILTFLVLLVVVTIAEGQEDARLQKVRVNGDTYLMIKNYHPPKGACRAFIWSNNSGYGPEFEQKMYPDGSEQFIVIDTWKKMRENPKGYLIHVKDVDDNILAIWEIYIAEGEYRARHTIPAPEPSETKPFRGPNVRNI